MRISVILGLAALFGPIAACTGGSYTSQSYHSECESRGLTPGSNAYERCLRDLRGREVIDFSFTRGRPYRAR